MTADFILNALGPGMLGPFSRVSGAASAPASPGVVVLIERRAGVSRPLDIVETLDIAATLADEIGARDERYAYALEFSTATDPAGYWRRAVASAVCERLHDAGWRQVQIKSTVIATAPAR